MTKWRVDCTPKLNENDFERNGERARVNLAHIFLGEFMNVSKCSRVFRSLIENSSGDYSCWNEFDNVFEIE